MQTKKLGIIPAVMIIPAVLLALLPSYLAAGEQQFFALGDLKLESGETIKDCILGYRTYGTLNNSGSNAVLFPTWYAGTSSELEAFIGPGKMLDSSRYFVIGVDSFGNGISSSPSNSTKQKGPSFPEFTIGDMVKAQYRLITEKFGISGLSAVIGISMGGMQVFSWAAAYPDKTRKIIPITGSPRPAPSDLLFFQTQLAALENKRTDPGWDIVSLRIVAGLNAMASNTPGRFNALTSRKGLASHIEKDREDFRRKDPLDLAWQVKAILTHNIYALPEASANLARLNRSSTLIIISKQDIMLSPAPAREFAQSTGTGSFTFDSDCGHYIFQCEYAAISKLVSQFLEE